VTSINMIIDSMETGSRNEVIRTRKTLIMRINEKITNISTSYRQKTTKFVGYTVRRSFVFNLLRRKYYI